MRYFLSALFLVGLTVGSFAQEMSGEVNGRGQGFIPDYTFSGSTLKGWHNIGTSNWSAQNGVITAKAGKSSGYLLTDRPFQDVGVHALFKASPGTELGFLFRLEKTGDGMKGILVAIKDAEVGSYKVTLDAQGKETNREKLRFAGGIIRQAPALKPGDVTPARGARPPGFGTGPVLDLPIKRPSTAVIPGEWNQFDAFIDLNMLRAYTNDSGETGSATDETDGNFGPIALYVSGDGEVQFKDIKYQDAGIKHMPLEKSSKNFRVQRINDMYYSWGVGSGDFNRDGITDIAAGPYIYYGPDYTSYREIFLASSSSPSRDFTEINCQYSYDFNGDGWPDILTGPSHGTVYINPKGESRRWDKYVVIPTIQSEITLFRDIDGDGKPELIYAANGQMCYAKPDPSDVTKPWIQHPVSEKGYAMPHGIGVGDINGDGLLDLVGANGWWEHPKDKNMEVMWIYHPEAFGRYGHRSSNVGGSTIGVYDVNGDHLNDVVTALNAHGFGLAWFEQKRDKAGKISFVRHMISDDYSTKNAGGVTFSEPHGAAFADIDGDGIPDFITGKRYWSHLDDYLDPDPYGPPVIYVYKTVRNPKAPGGAAFVPELIHNRSGVGSDVLAEDLNKDGAIDIVTATDRGVFIYWNLQKGKGRKK
ncbi:MAG TPA: FG-GAP-like repeat-containing protein [Mucilaginibacter sp.]